MQVFKIAVRTLVEHGLRSGDLRSDYFGSISAVEGIRAHQKVQRQRPGNYRAEVPVAYGICRDNLELALNGRIDGLFERDGRVVVEEIKTSRSTIEEIEATPNALHWGQAQCYAFMYAAQQELPQIDVQLTYVNPRSGRLHETVKTFSFGELEAFFEALLARYLLWLKILAAWRQIRNASLGTLRFPFENYRPGQRTMAVETFRTLRDGGHLFVQAATGIGKTMAVLFPALKALADGMLPKVVFLTARTTGRLAAEAALEILRQQGARLKSLTLTAKEKICFSPEATCTPEECPYARGFYDRIQDAVQDVFENNDALTREAVEKAARDHSICPFEFSLELIQWSDCLIGDYNYAFDPTATLKRLFLESGDSHSLLVDEAHNLVDRSREMFSAELVKSPVLSLKRALKSELPDLSAKLGRIDRWMAAARRACREAGGCMAEKTPPEPLLERLRSFTHDAERWLAKNIRKPFRQELIRLFFDFTGFVRVAEGFDHSYATISESPGKDFCIKLFCIDPASQLRQVWQRCRAVVYFSATLSPADYFQTVLGCCDETRRINLTSPFPDSRLAVFTATRISTYFKHRENSCAAVSNAIAALVGHRKGNYLLFFPSYAYLKMVYERFAQDFGHVRCIVQSADMDDSQREFFLNQFNEQVPETLAGFAVMGGVFGEGIDLKGERLTGVIVVGVGLPGICLERDLIRDYYQRWCGRGFEFAYQFPGMIRVLQAAGRVIRSETDKGVVLLIDTRYAQQRYRDLLPAYWQLQDIGEATALRSCLDRFWFSKIRSEA